MKQFITHIFTKISLVSGLFMIMALPAGPLNAKVISANHFLLKTDDGRVTAQLSNTDAGMPALFFFDKQNKIRLNLFLYPEGVGGLVMNDPEERAVAILRVHGSHERPVLVFKSGGQDRVIFGLKDSLNKKPYLQTIPATPLQDLIEVSEVPKSPKIQKPLPNQHSSSSSSKSSSALIFFNIIIAGIAGFVGGRVGVLKKENKVGS